MALAGTVVVLNGPPSAGKRVIAKQMQRRAEAAFIGLGLHFLSTWMVPPRRAGDPLQRATQRRYLQALHVPIAAHARAGCNVVVDHTLLDIEWHAELALEAR